MATPILRLNHGYDDDNSHSHTTHRPFCFQAAAAAAAVRQVRCPISQRVCTNPCSAAAAAAVQLENVVAPPERTCAQSFASSSSFQSKIYLRSSRVES